MRQNSWTNSFSKIPCFTMLLNAFQDVKRPLNLVEQKLERVIRICINEQVTIFIKTSAILLVLHLQQKKSNCNCAILTKDLISNWRNILTQVKSSLSKLSRWVDLWLGIVWERFDARFKVRFKVQKSDRIYPIIRFYILLFLISVRNITGSLVKIIGYDS